MPIVIFADEMQKYDIDSPFSKLVTEGRKFGITVIGATQEYRGKGDSVGKAMSNSGVQIFFRPTNDSMSRVYEALNKKFSIDYL